MTKTLIDLGDENDNLKYKELIEKYLNTAKSFEIHCYDEETIEIELALKYGEIKNTDWQYGKVINGVVTDDFKQFILSLDKPQDVELYNKMTPFFSIFLDNGFNSEHYGTENYVPAQEQMRGKYETKSTIKTI